ncbi:hypothetical protein QQ045_002299 [Rhodiola kirilowii]
MGSNALMGDEKDEFFVVRKGDLIGVFNNLNDCHAQVGSTICDPPVSVYKGHSMWKDTAEYLASWTLVVLRISVEGDSSSTLLLLKRPLEDAGTHSALKVGTFRLHLLHLNKINEIDLWDVWKLFVKASLV